LGFKEVASLAGGIKEWNGLTASGPPEAGMVIFSDADSDEDLIALSWILEEGSRKFYAALADHLTDSSSAELFRRLVFAEEEHKEILVEIYGKSTGAAPPADFPEHEDLPDIMEGGIRVNEGLRWATERPVVEVLQFSMSLETNAYDLYLKMARRMKEKATAHSLFTRLAEEERAHLQMMERLLEEKL
jgi:rubrerythrin